MARIVYTGNPIQASTIDDYYNRLNAIRTWNNRYSAISNRGSVGAGVKITSAQIMNEIFKSVTDTKSTVSFLNSVVILVPTGASQGNSAVGKTSLAQIEKSIGIMEQACREHFSSNRSGFNSGNFNIFGSFSSNRSGFNGTNRGANNNSFLIIGNNAFRSGYQNGNRSGFCNANRSGYNGTFRSGFNDSNRSGYHNAFRNGYFGSKWASNDGSNYSAFGTNSSNFSSVNNAKKASFATGKYHHHFSYWVFNWASDGSKAVQLSGSAYKFGNFDGHKSKNFSANGKNSTNRSSVNKTNRSPYHTGGYAVDNATNFSGKGTGCTGNNAADFGGNGIACTGNDASNYVPNAYGFTGFFGSNFDSNFATNDSSVALNSSNFSGVFSGNNASVNTANFTSVTKQCFTVHSSYTVEGVDF